MDILGNALLSKNFMYSGLTLTDEALYKRVNIEGETKSDRVFLTKDTEVICSLVGLNFGEVIDADKDEFYEMLLLSPMFNLYKFRAVRENNTAWMLSEFAEFIGETEVDPNDEFKRVPSKDYLDLNPNFEQECADAILWLNKGTAGMGKLFSGLTIKSYFPNYDMTRLSTTIPKFWDSFESKKESMLFLLKNDNKSIHEHFNSVTE